MGKCLFLISVTLGLWCLEIHKIKANEQIDFKVMYTVHNLWAFFFSSFLWFHFAAVLLYMETCLPVLVILSADERNPLLALLLLLCIPPCIFCCYGNRIVKKCRAIKTNTNSNTNSNTTPTCTTSVSTVKPDNQIPLLPSSPSHLKTEASAGNTRVTWAHNTAQVLIIT